MTVTLADIQSARRALRDVISATPILVDERLTQDLGARVFLKAENTQRSGSFKTNIVNERICVPMHVLPLIAKPSIDLRHAQGPFLIGESADLGVLTLDQDEHD